MKPLIRILGAAVLGAALLAVSSPRAVGGLIGGPASDVVTVPAHQSVFFDVPFATYGPALVSVSGRGNTTLELYVYDADGNVTAGTGSGDRRVAVIGVYRTGTFRIEIRNIGPTMGTAVVATN